MPTISSRPSAQAYVSGAALTNPANLLADDGSLATVAFSYPNFDSSYLLSGFAPGIPVGQVVSSVVIKARGSGTSSPGCVFTPRINGIDQGAPIGDGLPDISGVISADISDRRVWTTADVSQLELLMMLAGNGTASIDAVWVEFTYADAPAPPVDPPYTGPHPGPDVATYFRGGAVVAFRPAGQGGYIHLGNLPDFGFDASSDLVEHETYQYGGRTVDRRDAASKALSFQLTTDELSEENLNLFFGGSGPASFLQGADAGPIAIPTPIVTGRWYDLGVYRVIAVNDVTHSGGSLSADEYELRADLGLIRTLVDVPGGSGLTFDGGWDDVAGVSIPVDKIDISVEGDAVIVALNDEGRLVRWRPHKALLTFNGKTAIEGRNWAKLACTVEILPDPSKAQGEATEWGTSEIVELQ